jgi:hypothetical protein
MEGQPMDSIGQLEKKEDEKQKLKFLKKPGGDIPDDAIVNVIKMNHLTDIVNIKKDTSKAFSKIKKLSKEEYMMLDTGEIREYQLSLNRGENTSGIMKSMNTLKKMINNNFLGVIGEYHITLTYKENMKDTKRLYGDFEKFWKRFKYKYPKSEYIVVMEPQGRGAWHCHLLAKTNFDNINVYHIMQLWKHGTMLDVKPLTDIDNIGLYLGGYFTDIELKEGSIREEHIDKESLKEINGKKYIKGGRLHLYPSGMNFYRCSRGIIKPEKIKMKYSEAKKITGSAKPSYTVTTTICTSDDTFLNEIIYQQYNSKKV